MAVADATNTNRLAIGSRRCVAIDNGLAFPTGKQGWFAFPSQGTPDKESLLTLNQAQQELVNKLDERKVAAMLVRNGIETRAIKPTIGRIRALKRGNHPIKEYNGNELPEKAGGRWVDGQWKSDLSGDALERELKEIDAIVKRAAVDAAD